MAFNAQDVFNRTAATYDQQRSRLIPGYEAFYRWAVDLIPPDAGYCIDLGAGTGLLASLVRARLPATQLHLVDISSEMLDLARKRFAGDSAVTFEHADYATAPVPGNPDAVISALSVHHLDHAAKQELFLRIAQSLRPGGVFINADQVLGPTPALEAEYRHRWLAQCRLLGASEDQIEQSLFRQQADQCATVEEQLVWMRQNFDQVDCWFKDGRFAVMAGTRG